MLEIEIPPRELFDEKTSEFITTDAAVLRLEHSLISISKWESKWHKPFLNTTKNQRHTPDEMMDYIRCMTIDRHVDPHIYLALTNDNITSIKNYINDPMTATTIADRPGAPLRREIITAELIYYWMVSFGIPFECEKWHVNKLITLIKVCSEKNNPKKMNQAAILAQNREINEARKRALRTRG